jgi:predicted enzyme related to lactoylglutathione lyase
MKTLISIFEIPAVDFSRAVNFYQNILKISIEEIDMGGVTMGLFPSEDDNSVSGAVIKGEDYKPSTDGVIIYLNAGDNLQVVLDRVETSNGKIVAPKTQISPEIGYYALFIDTEGNKVGLHSVN